MDEKTLKAAMARIAIVLGALAGSTESAQGQVMEEFVYDALGRLISVVPADGRQYKFEYDRAGNWTATGPATGTSPKPDTPTPVDPTPKLFERTITVPASSGQLNTLRRLAEYAGYSGRQPARIVFEVVPGVSILGIRGNAAIDSGTWPTDKYATSITLKVAGVVQGHGGTGGTSGTDGQPGGDAVIARLPMRVEVLAGGALMGGGGGGGGGAPSPRLSVIIGPRPGGGGGGGYPDGLGGAGSTVQPGPQPGLPGSMGGEGGLGLPNLTGQGGKGGAAGKRGEPGRPSYHGSVPASEAPKPGEGGEAGRAIRTNGHYVELVDLGGAIVGLKE